jgi:hypothetical protein
MIARRLRPVKTGETKMPVNPTAIRLFGLAAVALAAAVFDAGTRAHAVEWCASYGGGTTCGFANQQQCLATISGNGGYCAPQGNESGFSIGLPGTETQKADAPKPKKKSKKKDAAPAG